MSRRIEYWESPEQLKQAETAILNSEHCIGAIEASTDRHFSANRNSDARFWNPQDSIPFEKKEHPLALDDATLSAIYVNGLTEDNLPYYTQTIFEMFKNQEALITWAGRWTMEESRHGRTIERHQERNNIFNLNWIEKKRNNQIESAIVPHPPNATEGLIYVTIQEEATRIPHSRVSGRLKEVGDREGSMAYGLIAGDEGGHHRFYKAVATAIMEEEPDYFMVSLYNQIRNFDMPGTGIDGFNEHSQLIAASGIFDIRDLNNIVSGFVHELKIEERSFKHESAKKAQEGLNRYLKVLGEASLRHISVREEYDSGSYKPPLKWVSGKPVYL